MPYLNSFTNGFIVSLGLIAAIGAQNAHVIKTGISKENILLVALTCLVCDIVLIAAGVWNFSLVAEMSGMKNLMVILGVLFLLWYGTNSVRAAIKGKDSLKIDDKHSSRSRAMRAFLQSLSVTLLNPHAYLDTFFIIGGIAISLHSNAKMAFYLGAVSASAVWFFSLSYAATKASSLLSSTLAWRVINIITAVIMYAIAVNMLFMIEL